jgi:hypothetical protein
MDSPVLEVSTDGATVEQPSSQETSQELCGHEEIIDTSVD